MVDQLAADGSFDNVMGFSRSSSPEIELLDEASLERAAAFVSQTGELRLIVDATGFLHDEREEPQKNWRDLDTSKLARAFALNAYGYRASKAALIQLVRTAAIELRRQWPDAVCVALHPETVGTRLSYPFARYGLEVNTPRSAAHHLLTVIDSLPSALMRLLRLSQGIRYPGSPNDQKAPPSRLAADKSRALLATATSNVSTETI
jgi:NAD(P)-dependent dehydrogenase (short-subunit alcohol dehydrogenase family)